MSQFGLPAHRGIKRQGVEGMVFQMGGYWIIDVTVTAGGETDLIRFGVELDD